MPEDVSLVHKYMNQSSDRRSALVSELLIAGSAVFVWLFTSYFDERFLWLMWASVIGGVFLSLARYFNWFGVSHKPLIFVVAYHLIASAFLIFISPILGPFTFIWILLLLNTHLYFGRTGLALSVLALIATTELAILRELPQLDNTELALIGVQTVVISVVGYIMTKTQEVNLREAHQITTSEKAQAVERERLLALINSMGNAVIVADDNGKVKLYNAAALDLLDTNTSLENKDLGNLLKLVDKDKKPVNLMEQAKKQTTSVIRSDLRMLFSDGEMVNLYINLSPIRLGYRHTESGYTLIMRDITKEKSLEEERDEFISVVSHELRTPITIAEGNLSNAQLINEQNNNDETIGKAIKTAHDQVLFLSQMINDLATLSRAERNVLDVDLELISPEEIIEQLRIEYEPEARAKKLKFQTSIAKGTPKITNSKLYVKEIIQNFITNSLKYTHKGRVAVHAEPAPKGSVKFVVEDTGIGISKSDQRKLFDKFFRSEDYRTRESSGTGLGLYVTKKLATRINATIGVSSELNKGSTFTIIIPSLSEAPSKRAAKRDEKLAKIKTSAS